MRRRRGPHPRHVYLWRTAPYVAGTTACSTASARQTCRQPTAFFNAATGKGYDGRLFMDGEEAGNEGRGVRPSLDGSELPASALGRFSWENSVANPSTGDRPSTVGTDDSTPRPGLRLRRDEDATGNPVDRAGLTNGSSTASRCPASPPSLRRPASRRARSSSPTSAAASARPARARDGQQHRGRDALQPPGGRVVGSDESRTSSTSSRRTRSTRRAGSGALTFADVRPTRPPAARSRWRSTAPRAS